MLYLFPDVTVDRKGHVVVVVVRMLAVPFLAAERHYFDQAERLFLRLLHGYGRVFSAPRGKPSAVHDGGRRVHYRVIGRLEHRHAKTRGKLQCAALRQCGFKLKGPSIEHCLTYGSTEHKPVASRRWIPRPSPEIPICAVAQCKSH